MLSKSFFFPRNYQNVKYRLAGSDYDTPYYSPPPKLFPFSEENLMEVQTHPNNESIGSYYGVSWFEGTFGKAGVGKGEFLKPKGIDTDSEGNIFVADSENKRIVKFSQSGLFLEEFDLETDITFGNEVIVMDLIIDRNTDSIFLLSQNEFYNIIEKYDLEGNLLVYQFTNIKKNEFEVEKPCIYLKDDFLYLSGIESFFVSDIPSGNYTTYQIMPFDASNLSFDGIPVLTLNSPVLDFCMTSSNDFVVMYFNKIQKIGVNGYMIPFFSPSFASCIAIDTNDNIYVAMQNTSERFFVYDDSGTLLYSFGDTDFFSNQLPLQIQDPILSMQIATDGNLLVSDAYYNRISVLDPNDGSFINRAYLDGQGYSTTLTEADLADFDADLTDRYGVDADTQIPEYIYFTPLKTLVVDLMEAYNADFSYQDTVADEQALINFAAYAKKTPYGIKKIHLRCSQQEDEQLRLPIIWFRTNKDGSELLKRLLPAKYGSANQNNGKIFEMILDKPYLVDNITYLNFEVVGDESILEVFLAEREAAMDIIRFMLARYGAAVDDYNTLIPTFSEPTPATTGGVEAIIWYDVMGKRKKKTKIAKVIEALTTSTDTLTELPAHPKSFWQEWWFWVILITILMLILINKKE